MANVRLRRFFPAKAGRSLPKEGDQAICLLLALPSAAREGAALYGRCVRPLTAQQAKELNALSDVAHLAHSHQSTNVVPTGTQSR